jgi:hypothetical protein
MAIPLLTMIFRSHPAQQAAPGVAPHLHQLAAEQVFGTRQMLGQIGHLTGKPRVTADNGLVIEQDLPPLWVAGAPAA